MFTQPIYFGQRHVINPDSVPGLKPRRCITTLSLIISVCKLQSHCHRQPIWRHADVSDDVTLDGRPDLTTLWWVERCIERLQRMFGTPGCPQRLRRTIGTDSTSDCLCWLETSLISYCRQAPEVLSCQTVRMCVSPFLPLYFLNEWRHFNEADQN